MTKIPGSLVIPCTASIFNEKHSYGATDLHRTEATNEESTMKALKISSVATLIFLLQSEAIRSSASVEEVEDSKVMRYLVVGPALSPPCSEKNDGSSFSSRESIN